MCSAYEGFPPCPRVAMNGLVRRSVLWKCRLIWSAYIQLLCKLSTSCVASVAFFCLDIACCSSRALANHRVGLNKRYTIDTNTYGSNNCNKRYQDFHFKIIEGSCDSWHPPQHLFRQHPKSSSYGVSLWERSDFCTTLFVPTYLWSTLLNLDL